MMMGEGRRQAIATCQLRLRRISEQRADRVPNAEPFAGRQNLVDPTREIERVIAQRWQAAGRNDELPRVSLVDQFLQRADRLRARGAQETTGIDDHHIGIVGFVTLGITALQQERRHPFGIDPVLGATQGYDAKRAQVVFGLGGRSQKLTCSSRTEARLDSPHPEKH